MYSNLQREIKKIRELNSPFTRELMTIIISNNLVEGEIDSKYLIKPFHSPLELLKELESNAEFENSCQEKRKILPLGKYAEYLIGEGLNLNKEFDLLSQNLQINDEANRTVGEIDFILNNIESNNYYYIEFAQKYYLKTKYKNRDRFLGPSSKDWLKKKIEKMTLQQLMVTEKYKNQLPESISRLKLEKKIIMKGSLFIPLEEYDPKEASLTLGWWTNYNALEKYSLDNKYYFKAILNRKDWIFPFDSEEEMLPFKSLKTILKDNPLIQNGLMIVRYDSKKKMLDRGFLMRPDWPNI